jgi:hypothetical protein
MQNSLFIALMADDDEDDRHLVESAFKEKQDVELTKQAGASSFLAKPDYFEELVEMLDKFCTAILDNPDIPFQVIGC